jgi:hypothetical protein
MNNLFKQRAGVLEAKRTLYKLLLDMDPEVMSDSEVDLMYTLSKDKQIQYILNLKKRVGKI